MELYQLRTFVMVAETGNLTHAAERLFTSQPAISAQVKALEEELNIRLFTRTPKGMVLTENGRLLRAKAHQVLDASSELQLEAKVLQGELTGQVNLGLNTDAEFLKLSSLHTNIVSRYPQLKIQITQGISAELLQKITRGSLDGSFYFGWEQPKDVAYLELLEAEIVVAGHIKWEKQLSSATPEGLAQLPWINPDKYCPYSKLVEEIFRGKYPEWVTGAASENSMNVLMKAGAGLSFIRLDEAKPWIEQGLISIWKERSFALPLKFAYMKSRKKDPMIEALLEIVSETFS